MYVNTYVRFSIINLKLKDPHTERITTSYVSNHFVGREREELDCEKELNLIVLFRGGGGIAHREGIIIGFTGVLNPNLI